MTDGPAVAGGLSTLLAVALSLASCRSEVRNRIPASVRDSAGVSILENVDAPRDAHAEWRVLGRPVVRIGSETDLEQYRFDGVRGALRLSSGGFAVADGASRAVRFYTSEAAFQSSAGREGAGPGEFRQISLLGVIANDSIVVWDAALRRITVLAPGGELARIDNGPAVPGFFNAEAVYGDGSLLGLYFSQGITVENAEPGLLRPPVAYVRYDARGQVLDTIAELPGAQSFVSGEGGMTVLSMPFSPRPVAAISGTILYCGAADEFEIRSFSATGRLLRIVRLDRPNRPLTDAILRDWMDRQIAASRRPGARERIEQRYRDLPYATELPAYEAMLVDSDHNLWVAGYTVTDSEPTLWTVFDSRGRIVAEVETPAAFAVHQIGSDFILGVATDSLGVEQVQMLGLRKGK